MKFGHYMDINERKGTQETPGNVFKNFLVLFLFCWENRRLSFEVRLMEFFLCLDKAQTGANFYGL